jgi:hypothetical protein
LRSVTININRRCPLKCKHCSLGFSDSYSGEDVELDPKTLSEMIKCVDASAYRLVLLAGGEPSLSPDLIRAGIAASSNVGLLSAIVTAPIWARNEGAAEQFLGRVTGLDVVILSYDTYHLEFLSSDHYRNATIAAVKQGIGVIFHIAYTRNSERDNLIDSLGGLAVLARQINPTRTVMIGNAQNLPVTADEVRVQTAADLSRIPRSCVLGNALIDDDLGFHGCCWAALAQESPFSVPTGGDPLALRQAFERMEGNRVFQAVRSQGLVDSLSTRGRQAVAARFCDRRFSCECDLCLALMSKDELDLWSECVHPSGQQ